MTATMGAKSGPNSAEALSQDLLTALRTGEPHADLLLSLAGWPLESLMAELAACEARTAFWINAYNALYLAGSRAEGPRPRSRLQRLRPFTQRRWRVAGLRLSLNDIEHGILRSSRVWWARGWLRKPFPGAQERLLRLPALDPRVHFALHCGARGCPAIRFYSSAQIDAELDLATTAFLQTEVAWERRGHRLDLAVSGLFSMYLGDFGGRDGLLSWLRQRLPDLPAGPARLRFLPYDWSPVDDHFA
jgi:hypothetical protein